MRLGSFSAAISAASRQHQRPGRVPAAGAAHDLVEHPVELGQQLELLGLARAVRELRLVDALEREAGALVPEPRGDLRPRVGVAVEHRVMLGGHRVHPLPGVVVDVDHHVEAVVERPAHHLLDTVEIRRVDRVVRSATLVLAPGDGNADALEALSPNLVQKPRSDARVAPRRLAAARGIEGVAQVPTRLHAGGDLGDRKRARRLGGVVDLLRHGLSGRGGRRSFQRCRRFRRCPCRLPDDGLRTVGRLRTGRWSDRNEDECEAGG
jgi:hypothetical protein